LVGYEIRQIIDDNSTEVSPSSSDFWILVAALKVTTVSDVLNVLKYAIISHAFKVDMLWFLNAECYNFRSLIFPGAS
jgi:hypothetical protein